MIRKGKLFKPSSSHISSCVAQQPLDKNTNQNPVNSQTLETILPSRQQIQEQDTPQEKKKTTRERVLNIIDSPRRAIVNRSKKRHHTPSKIPSHIMSMDNTKNSEHGESKVLFWMEYDAPDDIIPKILSFAGPQTVQVLSKVSRHWNTLACSETVFRTMCEDYGKWAQDSDREPTADTLDSDVVMKNNCERFWKKYYDSNPMIPLDYPSIHAAAASKCMVDNWEDSVYFIANQNVRLLLEPVIHKIEYPLIVETEGNAVFTVESVRRSAITKRLVKPQTSRPTTPTTSPTTTIQDKIVLHREVESPPHNRRRLLFGCKRNVDLSCTKTSNFVEEPEVPLDQAIINYKTKRNNVPVIHIRQGQLRLVNVTLVHNARGTDIWNGQSAVQIQPRISVREVPLPLRDGNHPPTAVIERCKITSVSGRGIVVIDGGGAIIRGSYIRDCAGTGIYVGSTGSHVRIEGSDIVQNGFGNQERSRNSILRGHSGIYIEQGTAILHDCNISNNCLTGISAVSATNAILTLTDSDVVANGTMQIELPEQGSQARRRSSLISVSVEGEPRSRSGLSFSLQSDIGDNDNDSLPSGPTTRRESFSSSGNDMDGPNRRALFASFGRLE